ncbi:MAG: class I SAM-dependent methyltransferase [Acidobacteria bacterium]|nr:class I SAM-dependent methyltransferase [Acidobacteriota bacterium]
MIVRWSTGDPAQAMAEDILTDLAPLIARHPWFQARAKMAVAVLKQMHLLAPARVLDAGCGWGLTLAALEKNGYHAAGLDISRRSLERLDRPDRQLIEADLTQPLPTGTPVYDAVLALDVIEHLDDDRTAVTRLAQLVRPGGALVVSVPALPELFSEFDAVQGHRRRYTPDTLRQAFASSGLRLERTLWWGSWMVPVLRRQRRKPASPSGASPAQIYRRYLNLPPWPGTWALRLAFAVDAIRALRFDPRTGTSLFALARCLG